MKRAIALLLCLLAFLPILTACGSKPAVTEEEILPVAKALIERSVLVNDIFLGAGVPTSGTAFGDYLYADEAWEEEHDLHSVEDLLREVKAVYTDAIYNVLYLETITKDGTKPPDYQNRSTPATGLLVHKDREGWYDEGVAREFLFDTMRMTESTATTARVTITVRITVDDAPPQERTLGIPLVLTENGWRCDKLTCIAYDS